MKEIIWWNKQSDMCKHQLCMEYFIEKSFRKLTKKEIKFIYSKTT